MNVRKLKEGELRRFKSGLLGNKWKDCHVALFSDSTLAIYDKKGDSKAVEQFFLKDIAPYICVGLMTDRMPVRRPSLPNGASVHHLVGFGQDPRAEKVTWLLFASDSDLEAWFNSITQTLPKPQNPPPSAPAQNQPSQPNQPTSNQSGGYVPPAQYPSGPNNYSPSPAPPTYNRGPSPAYNNGPPPATQPYYGQGPPQATHTTVVVDRDRSYGGGYGSGSSGLGFGSGALLGGLLGYGLGSAFTPHYYSSGFGMGGFGMGHGFGGGYPVGGGYSSYQDNDTSTTNITNNYYNTTDSHDTSNNDTSYDNDGGNYNDTSDNYQDDYQDNYDQGDFDGGDYDQGGFDAGDGGFDGGDW